MASSGPPARELGVWVGRSGTGGGQGGVRLCVAVLVAVWQLISIRRELTQKMVLL